MLGRIARSALGRPDGRTVPDLVVMGLGNPGPRYERTLHNAGFWAVDELAGAAPIDLSERRRSCVLGEGAMEGRAVVLAKPRTYVNLSGAAARYLLDRYRVGPERLLVVCDDMDLAPGALRLRAGGGPGGHNGMRSVAQAVGDRGFPRLRIGVGRPSGDSDDVEHVLGPPGEAERELIDRAVSLVPRVVAGILSDGIERTMDWANRRPEG